MRRMLASLICAARLTVAEASDLSATLEDILLLAEQGISSETILVFLQNREIEFTLDADAVDRLLQAGVSKDIISYLLARSGTGVARRAGALGNDRARARRLRDRLHRQGRRRIAGSRYRREQDPAGGVGGITLTAGWC